MFDCSNGSTSASLYYSSPVNLNTFYAMASTLNGSTMRIYNLGNFDRTTTFSFTPAMSESGMYIGGGISGYYFKGKIYSVRVYNRTLTAEEIKSNYLTDKKRFGI